MHEPPASKPWSQSARACGSISAGSPKRSPAVWQCATITAPSNGSQYMSDHFQKELAFLGIESSPAFVRSPEGNGCAERFIRTLKENLLWVRAFETVEELRQALLAFRETYNTIWLVERHVFLSPAEYRKRQLQSLAQAA